MLLPVASLMLLFILVETIADEQQYSFQSEKYRRINNGDKLEGDDFPIVYENSKDIKQKII